MNNKLIAAFVLLMVASAVKADVQVSGLRVKSPIPGQTVSAGYFDITNNDSRDVSLLSVSSNEAQRVEMHTHSMKDGMMSMHALESVMIKAGEKVSFSEGGHHLMIFDADTKSLFGGDMDIVFELSDGSRLEVTAVVEQLDN